MNGNPPVLLPGRVLIVDDDDITRLMVRRVLEQSGHVVFEATDGIDALALIALEAIDLVLLDVQMPRLNGYDTCQQMRSLARTRHTPVLMLTALDDAEAARDAFNAGATDFITKPINWVLLDQRVVYSLRTARNERELRENQIALSQSHRLARLGPWRVDFPGARLQCSSELRALMGSELCSDVSVAMVLARLSVSDRRKIKQLVMDLLRLRPAVGVEITMPMPTGQPRYLMLAADIEFDEARRPVTLHGVVQDVSERRAMEAQLVYQAHFDDVTGLPNHILFRDRLVTAIAESTRDAAPLAVMLIEMDLLTNWTTVGQGRSRDRLLREITARLATILHKGDTVCRLDTDTFGVLLTRGGSATEYAGFATKVMEVFADPVRLDTGEALARASIGIALYPADGRLPDALIESAAGALSAARDVPGAAYSFFTPGVQAQVAQQLDVEVALYRALEREEFILHFQPKLDILQDRVTGVEVLLRWNRPGLGLQSPDSFIPILEKTGLIVPVGRWILKTACEQLLQLPLSVAINVAPQEFLHEDMLKNLTATLENIGFPLDRLELEITEQLMLGDTDMVSRRVSELASMGIKVTLDDYGTGFSSLERLKRFPFDVLKIDKAFITHVVTDKVDSAIVMSTLQMCRRLGFETVAEGVEDMETLGWLRDAGCDIAQGYGISRPLPLDRLLDYLAPLGVVPFPSISKP